MNGGLESTVIFLLGNEHITWDIVLLTGVNTEGCCFLGLNKREEIERGSAR
jgi:hypothetical protein